jgi:hypothetical protein
MSDLYSSKPLCREDLLMSKLKVFFNNKEYLKILIDIISGNSEISLRDIDWFVTNFSKKYNVIYNIEEIIDSEIIKKQFIVFINYKSQLKAFGKGFFDPFCRNKRIQFNFEETKSLVTTVGQLNFFKWAISNKIIDYITEHLVEIKKDMNVSTKHLKKSNIKEPKTRRKRTTLSVSASRTINKHDVSITVNFGDIQNKGNDEKDKIIESNEKKQNTISDKITQTLKNLNINNDDKINNDINNYFKKYINKNNILVNSINC